MTRTPYKTRVFRAGSFGFHVESNERQLRDAIEVLFADLSDGSVSTCRFVLTDEAEGTRLEGADLVPFTFRRNTSAVLDELVTAVNRLMLDAGAHRLHLHAGAISKDDRAVLVSAPSGTGKTTLVSSLALRGWTYLTDEAVALTSAERTVRSFPKPLSVKRGGQALFPELAEHRASLGGTESGLWQVPVGAIGVATADAASPTMIVVLTRGAESEASWQSLSRSDTVVALVEQSLDFERYGHEALLSIAKLCSACRCVHVEAGTPGATADLVESLALEPLAPAQTVRPIVVAPSSQVATEVVSVAIGATAAAHHSATGRCISLNDQAARIWSSLCDGESVQSLGPGALSLAAQLMDLGFVRASDA